jgi:hypothetical protein
MRPTFARARVRHLGTLRALCGGKTFGTRPSGVLSMNDPTDLDAVFAELEAQLTTLDTDAPPVVETAAAVEDRRDAPRLDASYLGGDFRLSIRGGADAKAVDVSETGALAETTSRLRPGGVVELLLQVDGVRRLIRATVVRSTVHSLGPTIFRTAFKFEERTKLPERK